MKKLRYLTQEIKVIKSFKFLEECLSEIFIDNFFYTFLVKGKFTPIIRDKRPYQEIFFLINLHYLEIKNGY